MSRRFALLAYLTIRMPSRFCAEHRKSSPPSPRRTGPSSFTDRWSPGPSSTRRSAHGSRRAARRSSCFSRGPNGRRDLAAGRRRLLAALPQSGFGLAADVADARGGRKARRERRHGWRWNCYRAVLRTMVHVRRRESLIDRRVVNLHQVSLRKRLATWAVDPRTTIPQLQRAWTWWSSASPGPSGMRLHSGHNISTDAKLALWEGRWPAHRLTDQLLPAVRRTEQRGYRELLVLLAGELYRREHGGHPPSEQAFGGDLSQDLARRRFERARRWNDTDRIGFGRLGLDNAARKFQALNNCIASTAAGNMVRIAA